MGFGPQSHSCRTLFDGFHGILDLMESTLWAPNCYVTIVLSSKLKGKTRQETDIRKRREGRDRLEKREPGSIGNEIGGDKVKNRKRILKRIGTGQRRTSKTGQARTENRAGNVQENDKHTLSFFLSSFVPLVVFPSLSERRQWGSILLPLI